MNRIILIIFLIFFSTFCFSQEQNELVSIDKLELNKTYKLNFNYNYNNTSRFDKNMIFDLEKIKQLLNENPDLIALISVKINQKGNEQLNRRVTDSQKMNIEKEIEKLNLDSNKVKILSLGNKYFKQGYAFPSHLDVRFLSRADVNNLDENGLINLYLNNFTKNELLNNNTAITH